jgi:spoIIIJ-associated protein
MTEAPASRPTVTQQSRSDAAASAPSSADPASEETATPQNGSSEPQAKARPSRLELLEQEGDVAADFLEDLLDIADLDGDIDMDVDGDRASVSVVGGALDQLVGRNGEVLEALQELTRLAVYRETGQRSRLMLDVAGHRAARRQSLIRLATEHVDKVKSSGEASRLEPMSPFERKVVHDAVAEAGLRSESEGDEPRRRVVVLPA